MIKRILPKVLLLLLLIAGKVGAPEELRAQNTIGFSNYGFTGINDSLYAGDSVAAGAFIKNYSSQLAYIDSIQLMGYIDTGAVVPLSFPPFYDSIMPLDSIFAIMLFDVRDAFMGGPFKIGNNTIVIWPASYNSNFITSDTLRINVLVIDTINGLGPQPPERIEVRCYPVPGSGPLYITSTNSNINPVSAIVYDAEGRIVQVSPDISNGIITQILPPGVYFVEVLFDNEQRRTYKIVRW